LGVSLFAENGYVVIVLGKEETAIKQCSQAFFSVKRRTLWKASDFKASAKLQVRPILLKKISFMIFFNNYLSDYETIRCHRKEKINKRFFLF